MRCNYEVKDKLKTNFCFSACLFVLILSCNSKPKSFFWKGVVSDSTQVYIAYRGTNTKQGFLANDFNMKDSLSSHVGLLLSKNNNWQVYNVIETKDSLSDFKEQSLEQFYDVDKEKIFYASFWKIKHIDSLNLSKLKKLIGIYEAKNIIFDKSISLNDSTKLYCSEFIRNILYETDSTLFDINPVKIGLKGLYKAYFRSDTLEYYPVDIFQQDSNFSKVKEWNFE